MLHIYIGHRPNFLSAHSRGQEWEVMAKQEELLSSKEVDRILDMNPDDVTVLARKGELRARRLGRYWSYHYRDVMLYLEQQEKGGWAKNIPSNGRMPR